MDEARAAAERLADLMDEYGLDEAEIEQDGLRIGFGRIPPEAQAAAAPYPAIGAPIRATADPEPAGTPVTSPTGGVFYNAPSPGAKPFVEVGSTVQPGDVIGLIEAMKVFNEISSHVGGTVLATPAANGQVVSTGDVLIVVG
jgi:acetyl-CoA carboxylase biotin carboxyl carrier protein